MREMPIYFFVSRNAIDDHCFDKKTAKKRIRIVVKQYCTFQLRISSSCTPILENRRKKGGGRTCKTFLRIVVNAILSLSSCRLNKFSNSNRKEN